MDYLNGEVIGIGLGVVSSILAALKILNVVRKKNVATAIYHAYNIVNDIAAQDGKQNGLDKTAEALKAIDKWMVAQGWRPLKPNEAELAKLAWSSLHGQEKATGSASVSP